jgi:type I restriction enzyme S subunit
MKSNYKPLGKYIQPVDERNTSLEDLPLMGLSVSKVFFPTIANLVGTDMKTYKLVYRNQFTYIADTSRRGDKIAIALNDKFDKMLVSQAYTPFKVKDRNELDPEYLMMWFRRPEFDRYARFKSHGSAREVFDWEEMCNTLLPIPHIDKQREIVKEYNIIQNRIELNQKLIQKLEEIALITYRKWFIEFEFPDENGKPYKSNDGEMVWNEVLGKEIPMGWKIGTLEDIYKFQYGIGNTNPNNGGCYPIYGAGGIIGGYNEYNSEDSPVIGHMGEYCGKVTFAFGKHFVTYNGIKCIAKNEKLKWFSYLTLFSKDLMSNTRGSSQPFISYDMIYEIETILPNNKIALMFDALAKCIFMQFKLHQFENQKLTELKDLLLSKLATVE